MKIEKNNNRKFSGFLYYFNDELDQTNRRKDAISKIVEFQDVVKIYGKGEGMQVAVEHVNFTIEESN